jgi:hypothetical protein
VTNAMKRSGRMLPSRSPFLDLFCLGMVQFLAHLRTD